MTRFTRAGHRMGVVIAAIPALLAILLYFKGVGPDAVPEAAISAIVAAILYLFCLGMGWVLSAIMD